MPRWRAALVALAVLLPLLGLFAQAVQAVQADDVVEHGTPLPPIPDGSRVYGLALSGGTVYVGLRPYPGTSSVPMTIYATAADGTGTWATLTDPDTDLPLQSRAMPVVHEGLLLVAPAEPAGTSCSGYRLLTPGGTRSFESCSKPDLSADGLLMRTAQAGGPVLVERQDGTLLFSSSVQPFVADGVAWTNNGGILTGTELGTGEVVGTRYAPGSCRSAHPYGVADGFAVVSCEGGDLSAAVDLAGDLPPWPLDFGAWKVGEGYVVRVRNVGGGSVVDVVDLGAGKARRHFAATSRGLYAIDHGGAPRLAALVSETTVEISDLGPLAARATGPEDADPPVVSGFTGPPAVVRATPDGPVLRYAWTGTDPGHGKALFYQLRSGVRPHGGATITWGDPRGWLEESWSEWAGRWSDDSCLQVRAVDWAGNTGAWTQPLCTYTDEVAPWLTWVGSWTPIASRPARTPVVLGYRATDDDLVASYDVLTRTAAPGRPWGAWTAPAGWQRITATSVRRAWPAGSNVCFLVRARDRAGNLAQSYPSLGTHCTAIPYDDRVLVRSRGAKPIREAWALSGTTTVLTGKASLSIRRMTASKVWVAMRGRGGYCPRLWVGGKRIADWRCHWYPIGKRSWYVYTLPRTMTGAAVLRAGRYDRIRVDAVAFAR